MNTLLETKPLLKEPRRSSLELLRIVCMIFIVAHHFGVHGEYGDMQMSLFNQFILLVLKAGGKLGVNAYVLISGYFLVNSRFKIKRILSTVGLAIFYSVISYIAIMHVIPSVQFSASALFKSIFVIKNNGYWFVTCYVAMILLSPFINKLIYALKEKEHLLLIIVLLFMQAFIPGMEEAYFSISPTGWFITLYLIAAYIRLYPKGFLQSKKITGFCSLALCTVIGLLSATRSMENIVCLSAAIFLFCFFNNLNIKTNRFINLVSKTTFGIYLIHDNNYMRKELWSRFLDCPFHAGQKSFWLFSACAVTLVFVVCSLIELLRIGLTSLATRIIKKIHSKIKAKKQPQA